LGVTAGTSVGFFVVSGALRVSGAGVGFFVVSGAGFLVSTGFFVVSVVVSACFLDGVVLLGVAGFAGAAELVVGLSRSPSSDGSRSAMALARSSFSACLRWFSSAMARTPAFSSTNPTGTPLAYMARIVSRGIVIPPYNATSIVIALSVLDSTLPCRTTPDCVITVSADTAAQRSATDSTRRRFIDTPSREGTY
jgi:hypothetical protein